MVEPQEKMNLRWFGQSCFYLTSGAGTRLLMDPYAKWFGYRMPQVQAQAVTTSHTHFDHNNIRAVHGDFQHIDRPGNYQAGDITIHGTLAWHDAVQGAKRGRNIIFTFAVDGLNVCHLGDLGHLLSPQQVAEIGRVDILLLPVGGAFAISVPEALQVRRQLQPAVTIPMHYRTKALGLGGLLFARLEVFLSSVGEPARKARELSVDPGSLAANAGILLLSYDQPKTID